MKLDSLKLKNRARFIKMKIDKIIDSRNMKIKDLIEFMDKNKFNKMNNSYDYIFDFVTTKRETEEEAKKLLNEYDKILNEIKNYKQLKIKDLWIKELDELEIKLHEMDEISKEMKSEN